VNIEHRPVNFEDERGTIRDIFVHSPKESCTVIFSRRGSVRGNHYHKLSTQYTYVVSGRLTILTQMVGSDVVESHVVNPGDMVTHQPMEAHTLIADEDTVFLAFTDGLRAGEDYELDTYRLDRPLG
jgi:quercetin dioxygenase-like cupin family protein